MWSDFDIELNTQRDGDITKDEDIEAIKNSLLNIVSTIQGSRRMLPEFAQALHDLLFEPMSESTAYQIAYNLIDAINVWDNRVKVEGLNIKPIYDENTYKCIMEFTIINQSNIFPTEIIDFVLKRI